MLSRSTVRPCWSWTPDWLSDDQNLPSCVCTEQGGPAAPDWTGQVWRHRGERVSRPSQLHRLRSRIRYSVCGLTLHYSAQPPTEDHAGPHLTCMKQCAAMSFRSQHLAHDDPTASVAMHLPHYPASCSSLQAPSTTVLQSTHMPSPAGPCRPCSWAQLRQLMAPAAAAQQLTAQQARQLASPWWKKSMTSSATSVAWG